MNDPNQPTSVRSAHHGLFSPAAVGTACGVFSALGYTAANICLRAVSDCDPVWVSCVKAIPTMALVGPWLLMRIMQGRGVIPSASVFWALTVSGLVCQLLGNVIFQWALGVVGIALTVPLTLGTMIASGVVAARWYLGERVSARMLAAMAVLIVAIAVLSAGAGPAGRSVNTESVELASVGLIRLVGGVLAACVAGVAYCSLGVCVRYATNQGTPLSTILMLVSLVGMLGLGALSVWSIGPEGMRATAPGDLGMMLAAGSWNAVAFLALAAALQLTSLVYVNALNASQAAMAAVAGVLLFHEARSWPLLLGVGLTIVGLLIMKPPDHEPSAGDVPT